MNGPMAALRQIMTCVPGFVMVSVAEASSDMGIRIHWLSHPYSHLGARLSRLQELQMLYWDMKAPAPKSQGR